MIFQSKGIKMTIHQCKRCNAKLKSSSAFNQHTCKGMRNLMTMNFDLLTKVVNKEITEAQAWAIQDGVQAQ
jgi:hypothetical protein